MAVVASPELTRPGSAAETLARTISLSAINLQFILHRIVHERLERRPAGILCELDSSAGAEELDDYWPRLAQLAEEVDFAVFECSREIVVLLKVCDSLPYPQTFAIPRLTARRLDTAQDVLQAEVPLGTHEWLDPRSVQVLFSRTTLWAGAIVHARTREEGGMLDYSIEDKLTDLRWSVHAFLPSKGLELKTYAVTFTLLAGPPALYARSAGPRRYTQSRCPGSNARSPSSKLVAESTAPPSPRLRPEQSLLCRLSPGCRSRPSRLIRLGRRRA